MIPRTPTEMILEHIDFIKDDDFLQAMKKTETEAESVETRLYKTKGCVEFRKLRGGEYSKMLGNLLFIFRSGMRPNGASDYELKLYKSLFENYVKKKQLKEGIIKIFPV